MRRSLRIRVVLALALLTAGCEFDLDVGAAWEVERPRVIGLRMEVVEPTPLWPERLGFDPDDAPIAEALPGDRVRLVPLVVDGEGRAQAPETIDALWFQCGSGDDYYPDCSAAAAPPCDSLDWTTDVACEIGRGPLEFPFPALGPLALESGAMRVLGIIGREPGVDAERCRAGLLATTNELSGCTLVTADVLVGPRWVLLVDAIHTGLTPAPADEIPYGALLQPANRAPAPGPLVLRDADTDAPLTRVRPGQRVQSDGPSWRVYDRQPYIGLSQYQHSGPSAFVLYFEGVGVRYFASGPITITQIEGSKLEFIVDELAAPGIIRLVVVVGDRRKHDSERGVIDMFVQEIELAP